MWHGDREARNTVRLEDHRLGPTAEAFRSEGLRPEACVYSDDFRDEVREQLLEVDAVQVWVNPIEQGRSRSKLDELLQEVSETGVLVSAHPDAIQKMGTKNVLYDTRNMAWGSDVDQYRTLDDLRVRLPDNLKRGPRVLKQHRGHSGQGIWKVTATDDPGRVLVRHAVRGSVEEEKPLIDWIQSCAAYFAEGPMIDQAYQERIADGMVRCYVVDGRIEGFGFQEVNALVPRKEPEPRLYFPPTDERFQSLKSRVESNWIPELLRTLSMRADELPLLWDADFIFGPDTRDQGPSYVLCEINVSSVFPYPESAMAPLARAIKARLQAQ